MNFRSHQQRILNTMKSALGKNKLELIFEFKEVLEQAKHLYKTTDFDFWLSAMESTELTQLPVTGYGRNEALHTIENLFDADRHRVKNGILSICENLLTYCNDDDMCECQGTYHYYYSFEENCVFKLSELGMLQGISEIKLNSYRIAFISELNIQLHELYG